MASRKTPPSSPVIPGLEPDWQLDESREWYTPPSIFEALDVSFDLDVCAPPGGVEWVPAAESYSTLENGLLQSWLGFVWMNPPYGDPAPWVIKMVNHWNGVALLPTDTSTDMWHSYVITADVLCFIKGRVKFIRVGQDREKGWDALFSSVLAAWGPRGADAVANCGLGWIVDQRDHQ